ncbi:MAG: hypothetical protein CMJ37_01830 [Phycisphaerae bacterium]|nr:hypothetical protein [Phycisphaerae bacterium]
MMHCNFASLLVAAFLALPSIAQTDEATFDSASADIQNQLEVAIAELAQLRDRIASETVPMSQKLSALEAELQVVRSEYDSTVRVLDGRTLDLTNLAADIKSRKDEASYLNNLLSEFIRNFEPRLHIAEVQRYGDRIEAARIAPESSNLSPAEVYAEQIKILDLALERLEDAFGGTRFGGTAVDDDGSVLAGQFVLIGPAGVFLSDDGRTGASHPDPRANSLEPSMLSFINPADAEAAQALVRDGAGTFPLDPTLLNARKIEETEETFLEHIQKGGPVMYPIAGMFVAAMLVSILKYFSMLFTPGASKRRIKRLGAAVLANDSETALAEARRIGGPTGRMLADGIEHMDHPKELVEEIMYESVLETKLKLQRLLPLVAIIAAAAPLMGLLGTVTGIINTFKMITVFGTGDPKTLSGGISEALITTKFGLVVAIPSLIIHAFLSRTAKGKIDGMEQAAISFTNVLAILQGNPPEEAVDQEESEEMTPTSAVAEESTQEDGED